MKEKIEKQDQVIIYQSAKGDPVIDVRIEEESVWLTQAQIVTLLKSSKASVSEHISHIYKEGELNKKTTVRKFRTVRCWKC
jgi:hypothetical protein